MKKTRIKQPITPADATGTMPAEHARPHLVQALGDADAAGTSSDGLTLTGTEGSDLIEAGFGVAEVFALGGDDIVYTLGRPLLVDGGDGSDALSFVQTLASLQAARLVDGWVEIDVADVNGAVHTTVARGFEAFAFGEAGSFTLEELLALRPSNTPPVAVADTAESNEDTVLTIDVLANDVDNDTGDNMIVMSVEGGVGTVSVAADGSSISYGPSNATQALRAGQTLVDTFTYTMRDVAGQASTASVAVTVTGVNDAPIAHADMVEVDEKAVLDLWSTLLVNDQDIDLGDTRAIVAVDTAGTFGQLTFDPETQTLRYAADTASLDGLKPGDSRIDSFAYTIRDEAGAESHATVTITVRGTLDDGDWTYGTAGADSMRGTNAADFFRGLAGNDTLFGGAGNDWLDGGAGDDQLVGSSGIDRMFGGAGNDMFVANSQFGRIVADGGDGIDTYGTYWADASEFALPVIVDLAAGTVANGYQNGSTLSNIENVSNFAMRGAEYYGNAVANVLTGNSGNDVLDGRGGDDTLYGNGGQDKLGGGDGADRLSGGAGHDRLDGGAGADRLTGGLGSDLFVLRKGEANGDAILDFTPYLGRGSYDQLQLVGYGEGAKLTHEGQLYTIHFEGGTETFTMNAVDITPIQYFFG